VAPLLPARVLEVRSVRNLRRFRLWSVVLVTETILIVAVIVSVIVQ